MKASYKKLFRILVDKDMSKVDLRKATGLSSNTDMICLGLDIEYAQTIMERSMYGLQKVIVHNE